MLETLTRGFTAAREKLGGIRELTEANVDASLRDVRMSLLEADVDLARGDGLPRPRQAARARREGRDAGARRRGPRRCASRPGQHFIKICEEELTRADGPGRARARARRPRRHLGDAARAAGRRQDHRRREARAPPLARAAPPAAGRRRRAAPRRRAPAPAARRPDRGPGPRRRRRRAPAGRSARAAARRARDEGFDADRLRHRRAPRDRRRADAGARGDPPRRAPRPTRCWCATR